MLDFNKITEVEISELKQLIMKNVEKSEMERLFLFSSNSIEKGKLFIYSYRFLVNAFNVLGDGELKNQIGIELELKTELYEKIIFLLNDIHEINYRQKRRIKELFNKVNTKESYELIDLFSILLERVNVLNISRFKGILLEGKSGQEYKQIFSEPQL